MHSNGLEIRGKGCCYFWFHSEVKLMRYSHLFGLSYLPYFNVMSVDFTAVREVSTFILFRFHVCKRKNALKCFKSFNDFLCIYLGEARGELMHVYVWDYTVSLYYRSAWWTFTCTKLGRDKEIMARTYVRCFGQIRLGADPGWDKNRSRRVSFFKTLLKTRTLQKQSKCIAVT